MIRTACILWLVLVGCAPAVADSLKLAYEQAGPLGEYDRYIVLQTGVTYTGGLWIGGTYNRVTNAYQGVGENVRIVGNGAILDLQTEEICIAYCNQRLDIDDCVILNGNVRFRGYRSDQVALQPKGSVRHVTFYRPHDYGVRLMGCGEGITVERNIVVDARDTGPDFMFFTGNLNDWLQTGLSVALSMQYTTGEVYDNWSYFSDAGANGDAVRHFAILCDYG